MEENDHNLFLQLAHVRASFPHKIKATVNTAFNPLAFFLSPTKNTLTISVVDTPNPDNPYEISFFPYAPPSDKEWSKLEKLLTKIDRTNAETPIHILINSDGDLTQPQKSLLNILAKKNIVRTICLGHARSACAELLFAGTPGSRYVVECDSIINTNQNFSKYARNPQDINITGAYNVMSHGTRYVDVGTREQTLTQDLNEASPTETKRERKKRLQDLGILTKANNLTISRLMQYSTTNIDYMDASLMIEDNDLYVDNPTLLQYFGLIDGIITPAGTTLREKDPETLDALLYMEQVMKQRHLNDMAHQQLS